MSTPASYIRSSLLWATIISLSSSVFADDWPMWRYDAQRSAASPNELPDEFTLLWKKDFSPREQAWDDPLNLDLMTYDRVFEPIVMEGRLFVGFNDRDKLSAFDVNTGEELWSAYADAPVRLPPVGSDGRVYFCSDDGFLYCVDATNGKRLWKFNGAPNSQHAIGNRRLTSAWPARGGPVVRDGTVYFAASIWPFMGTFIYALDAETGDVRWVNDNTGAQYIKQPHSAPSFAGVAPQGALVATESLLVVPGGRSVPAVFERDTGKLKYFELNAGGKGTGGSFVAANDQYFFVHTRQKGTRAFNLDNGIKTAFMPSEPVLSNGVVYSAETKDDKAVVRAYGADDKLLWEIDADGTGDLILAADKLIAAGSTGIAIIQLPSGKKEARIAATIPSGDKFERLIVADKKLFCVTIDGKIMVYGKGSAIASHPAKQAQAIVAPHDVSKLIVGDLLEAVDAQGYAIWYGADRSRELKSLAKDCPFDQLAFVSNDADFVSRLRRELDGAGDYGKITAHHSDARSYMAPKYVANIVAVDHQVVTSGEEDLIAKLYESVRPYGGVMYVLAAENREGLASDIEAMKLEQAKVEVGKHGVIVRRVGALPGSADWTHQYGDVANTVKSNDSRVKLPLGVLWFGGSSNMDVLPRHGHGPPEQVVGGRLFIQGMDCLSARDVYTGRVLWKRTFDNLDTFDVYYDTTYEDVPLNTKYNQVHIPGANGRGTNYVVADDRVYLVEGNTCHALDPATGETVHDFELPKGDAGETENWGYIGVYEDVLIGGLGFASYRDRHQLAFETDKKLKSSRAGFGSKSFDRAASVSLVGFDRHTGKQLWKVDANHSFWHNGIVAGGDQVYCLDRNPTQIEEAMRRRGIARPESYRIVAFDYRTGKKNWEVKENIFGTWLGYSEQHDLLLQAGASASDRLYGEVAQGMAVYRASDGSVQWANDSLKYSGPCILHNDLIITNANSYSDSAGAFYLQDGKQKLVKNPLTGEMQPWKVTRAYGCNSIIASENMLTFRSGAAGFYDLLSDAGTGNLGGFKSGCTSNLVVANGVLNAPDYTRTCSCAYQNQTSLALVHMPEMDSWSVSNVTASAKEGNAIHKVGINFGAPGDRRDGQGLLWLEHPVLAGDPQPVAIEINPEARFFQHHSSIMSGADRPWVLASGVDNVTNMRIALQVQDGSNTLPGIPIDHVADDAEEFSSGQVNLTSSDLELVEESSSQVVGMRFNNLQIARGEKVEHASIQFTCDERSWGETSLIISAEDSGNAERFTQDSHDVSSRTRTSQEIGWSPQPWKKTGERGVAQRTPDLSPLVQAVVNRPDWKKGNSLAFIIEGKGKRVAASSKGGNLRAPRLVFEAAEPAADPQAASSKAYDLTLYFAAIPPNGISDNDPVRVFDVYVQGNRVLENVTLDRSSRTGEPWVVHRLERIPVADELQLRFDPKQGSAVLSGIEIVERP